MQKETRQDDVGNEKEVARRVWKRHTTVSVRLGKEASSVPAASDSTILPSSPPEAITLPAKKKYGCVNVCAKEQHEEKERKGCILRGGGNDMPCSYASEYVCV